VLSSCFMTLALLIPGEGRSESTPPPVWDDRPALPSAWTDDFDYFTWLLDFIAGKAPVGQIINHLTGQTLVPVEVVSAAAEALTSTGLFADLGFQAELLLGQPSSSYILGSREYAVYADYGIQVGTTTDDKLDRRLVSVGLIPPTIPMSLPEQTRRDMECLQGVWVVEDEDKAWREHGVKTVYAFDGTRLTIVGGGVAFGYCYEINSTRKKIHFYLPDPEDEKEWQEHGMFPADLTYSVEGEKLQLSLWVPFISDWLPFLKFQQINLVRIAEDARDCLR